MASELLRRVLLNVQEHLPSSTFYHNSSHGNHHGLSPEDEDGTALEYIDGVIISKPQLVEPLDYENVIVKNRMLLDNDPHREMLLFPPDDVRQSTCPRKLRTVRCSVPPQAVRDATALLVRESIKTYTSNWSVIHYQYSAYSGSFLHLPRVAKPGPLTDHVFEVDAEAEGKDEEGALRMRPMHITRQGWLYKGPDSGQETSIISFTRSFKRRYFYLKQQADTTYIMEFHKDDKKLEAKGSIFLDSAVNVMRSSKRGKHAFELHMQNKSFYIFAAESEVDMEGWVTTLKKVISSNDSTSLGSLSDRISLGKDADMSPYRSENYIESLESSMNPVLQKYARETDSKLAQQRRENRQKLFSIYPDIQRAQQDNVDAEDGKVLNFREQFGTRFIVKCEEFKLRLQANLEEDMGREKLSNPEPFFITLALYDSSKGEKISEDFNFDPNCEEIRAMIPSDLITASDMLNSVDGATGKMPDLHGLDEQCLKYPFIGIFSVMKPNRDIYLVAKIDKVLQGGVNTAVDPYTRTPDIRTGSKINRQMKTYCSRLGHYRMPFAWGARPVFKPHTLELDTYSDFALYKQDPAKVSEEDILKNLQDIRKPEKQGKWTSILGSLKVNLNPYRTQLQNTVTSSLVPVKPFPDHPETSPSREVEEFVPGEGEFASPFVTYTNNLYVYPRLLKYDSQKNFAKARNIACYVEIRDSDNEGTVPLKCLYGRPGGPVFTTCSTCAVLHHNTSPEFMEEIKIALPAQLNDKHHLVFTFYHVSCELPKTSSSKPTSKKVHNIETVVGYAWFPLLINGRVNIGEQNIKVAMNLPAGYLSYEQLGLGKGFAGPDIKWVDGAKPLFKFFVRLVSTTYTKDQHLHNFFAHCQRMESATSMAAVDFETSNRLKTAEEAVAVGTPPSSKDSPYDRDMLKFVKSLHAVDTSTLINFMPTLFNQLFKLLPRTHSEDVAINAVRVLIHIVYQIHDAGKSEILHSYVKYVFVTEPVESSKEKSIHEELAKHLKAILRPTQGDQLVVSRFMKHSSFFFEVLVKSMAQHLLSTERIKMARNERFPSSYQFQVQNLVSTLVAHIVQKFKDNLEETKNANLSLANFIRRCFTFMDRGFVFRLINMYIDNFSPGDPKLLHEYKFEFLRVVCSHEHFIPLNLPMIRKRIKNYKDLKHDYTLSDEFRRDHFLVGQLLHEVKMALNEIRDIRKSAILTLRNLLAKHSFDDRYAKAQSRIAMLYLPFITVILENKHRLTLKDSVQTTPSNAHAPPQVPNGDISHLPDTPSKTGSLPSYSSNLSLSEQPAKPRIPDPSVFAMISGQAPSLSNLNPLVPDLKPAHHGSSSSLASTSSSCHSSSTATTEKDRDREKDTPSLRDSFKVLSPTHQRTTSTASTATMVGNNPFMVRYDKLDQNEIKDLLICFLYVVKNLSEDVLLGWFNNSSESDVLDFLTVLEICMQNFKYLGRKRITSLCIISDSRHSTLSQRASASIIGDTKRAMTLPAKKGVTLQSYIRSSSASFNMENGDGPTLQGAGSFHSMHAAAPSQSELDALERASLEANLSSEIAMTVLDVVSQYTTNFKDQLQFREGDNNTMQKVFDLYLHFLQTSQSESVQKHAFAAMRSFINKFPRVLFKGEANMCGRLCYEILRCCNSRLDSTRSEACALMYLLMRSNFEYSKRKSFTRVHLQMIISVSQLISDVVGLSNSRFTESLSIINSYASSDKAMHRTVFPVDVKDLTKRIRTVLMATAQMKEHQNDPEMLVDLQYSLAKSYASTPELRKTWLDSMARIHSNHNNYSEAAHCYIHIAALVAEYLRRRGVFPQGCSAFKGVSPNVEAEEAGMRDDSGMQDVEYTEDNLVELLEKCAMLMEQAERYELLGEIYRLVIPIYERKRDFERLSQVYGRLQKAYGKIVEVMNSGKRLLGKYFRVAFFGQNYFEEEDGKEYIYKEPKITGLPEICDRLKNMYSEKFGKGNVKLIMDSNKVNPNELDPKFAYVQVTYVTPYFEEKELADRTTEFERNNNIRRFMFETPFTKNGKPRGEIDEQHKRRTILTTSHAFPYVKKRILVVYHKDEVLSPIEVAIDEMKNKVKDLHDVIDQDSPDLKKLQLRLQGSVSVQVNAGPLAYAEAFLAEGKIQKYRSDQVAALKQAFRSFVKVCDSGLELNGRLVSTEQLEYQEALRKNFREVTDRLSDIFGEMLLEDDNKSIHSHRGSVTVFSVISATGNASSV